MNIRKIIWTDMMKRYMVKLAIRVGVFLTVLVCYFVQYEYLNELMADSLRSKEVTLLHILWLMFMVMMILHIFPTEKLTMALRKSEKKQFVEVPGYSELELHRFVRDQNIKAWWVMLVWLSFNALWGLLYCFRIIGEVELLMLTVFYFLCDYICILFYCPFQSVGMKNRCCVNCRIYDWGHFMMFTPMLFIRNFFSWSLFFTSLVVLIRWELVYAKYPERFWSGSNQTLQCANCKDKTCQVKRRLAHKPLKKEVV